MYISVAGEGLPTFLAPEQPTGNPMRGGISGINTINSTRTTQNSAGQGGGGLKSPGKVQQPKFPGGGRALGTSGGDRDRNS